MIRSCTARKGEIAVQRAILRALELGLTPSRPCIEGVRYDLIVDRGALGMARVQVKYCNHRPRSSDAYEISLTRHSGSRNRRLYRYGSDEVDAIVALLAAHDSMVWLPHELWNGRTAVTVRTRPAANGQRRNIHMLDQYRW
jgi:hypothetical protein